MALILLKDLLNMHFQCISSSTSSAVGCRRGNTEDVEGLLNCMTATHNPNSLQLRDLSDSQEFIEHHFTRPHLSLPLLLIRHNLTQAATLTMEVYRTPRYPDRRVS